MVTPPRALRPSLVDGLLAGFFATIVVAEAFTETVVLRPWVHALIGGVAVLAMAWRRVWPVSVAVAVAAAEAVLALNGGGLSVALALIVMSFTVGAETEGRRSWSTLGLLFALFLGGMTISESGLVPGDLAAGMVLIVGPWVAGRTLRARALALAEAMSREAAFEQEKVREAEDATTRERTRLARELHDIVSHSISVIAIQTQAVRRRLGPDQAREAADLVGVESAARDAMAEMRRLFGVLREQGVEAALAPQPGLVEVDRLLARVRDTGVQVDLVIDGEVVPLSPGLDLAAYRIVQEAVTNALRHSGASRLSVRLGYAAGELQVTVEDDGRGIVDGISQGGHGLRGIRERAELYGGALEVGRGEQGGARVHARLPVGSHP